MPKGNPNPVISPKFKSKQFRRSDQSTDPLAEKTLAVRVSVRIDKAVRNLPDKSAWLRRVISDAAERELLSDSPQPE